MHTLFEQVQWDEFKAFIAARCLSIQYREDATFYYLKAADAWFALQCVLNKSTDTAAVTEFEASYKALGNKKVEVVHPFADPLYRAKHDALPAAVNITASSNQTIDFLLTAERYVSGGELIIENAKFGDYITAEIVDIDSIIPVQYRASLCEAHPIVASYIPKRWVKIDGTYSYMKIDSRPLNAKISAGLYLRITYHACVTDGTRSVLVNYDLTKKL